MRRVRILAGALAACLLSGCGITGNVSVDELLRAPVLSGQHSQVQKALNGYLGESAQLKYPASGQGVSPFVFSDLDGDGTEDAAVLYTSAAKGQNVHLAVLEQEDGAWQVTQELEGLSTELYSVDLAVMQDAAGSQLVVGYGSPQGDQYLAVYSYRDETLECVLQENYDQYLLEDITGSGTQDLVLAAVGQELVQELEAGDSRFVGCVALSTSRGSDGAYYLVLDGRTGASSPYLASSLFRYDAREHLLEAVPAPAGADLYGSTLRYYTSLLSADIDGDGAVEIPTQLPEGEGGITSLAQEHRLSFVAWNSYTLRRTRRVSFGVLDEDHGFYLPLPMQWKGNVSLCDGSNGGWEVRSLEGDKLYLSVRLEPLDEDAGGYTRLATVGSQQVLARVGPDGGALRYAELSGGIRVL